MAATFGIRPLLLSGRLVLVTGALVCLLPTGMAWAQDDGQDDGPGLLSPEITYANDIERATAAAVQAAFFALNRICNFDGRFNQDPNPDPDNSGLPSSCPRPAFLVFLTTRELVHTANDLVGVGPTIASLKLDQQGLGTALRWTAAEELAAQGSMATEFANSQLSNLSARLNALRFGARGFTVAGFYDPTQRDDGLLARNGTPVRGGGASADDTRQRESYSPWGGFLNGSFGYGYREDTDREDAFDFDGTEVTLGLDYRFKNNFVLGAIFGYTNQTIDFDEAASEIRVVGGGMETEGGSGMLFGLFQGERLATSASFGYQTVDYDITRAIKYPSLNPNIESVNSIARSFPTADILSGTFSIGYALNAGRFTFEPYAGADYLDVTIDSFTEERSVNAFTGNEDDDLFSLIVAEQSFKSLDTTLGLRLQYTATPAFGVIVPFVSVEAHKELENDSRSIRAGFDGLATLDDVTVSELFSFEMPTDQIDDTYYTWAVGISTVLRGGRQRTLDGPITGGLMAFVQYKVIEGLENYDEQVISGGFRYEF